MGLALGLTAPAYGTISSPAPAASFSDGDSIGDKTFSELDGARNIVTTKIGGNTYAVVAAVWDNGVQIIDITKPRSPIPVATITDGQRGGGGGTFSELHGAFDVAIVKMDIREKLRTLALVTAEGDDGVQIIDITNPYSPISVASISDGDRVGDKTFDELDGAKGIAAAKIGNNTYAVVAAEHDNGVQIIDITDPYFPRPAASITDGQQTRGGLFSELRGAYDVTTVEVDINTEVRTLALVAAVWDNGVQIIDITDPYSPISVASITDGQQGRGGTFSELHGAIGIATAKIGDNTYALVAADGDDGVQIIDITDPAAPLPAASVTDGQQGRGGNTFTTLDGAKDIAITTADNNTYALVAAEYDDGVQIIDITDPLYLKAVTSVTDGQWIGKKSFDELHGAVGIATVWVDNNLYAVVAAFGDNGVQIIDFSTTYTKYW